MRAMKPERHLFPPVLNFKINDTLKCRILRHFVFSEENHMKYKTVIFDMDGTVLNTLDDLAASTNFALENNFLPSRTTDEVRSFVGNGIRKLIERAVPQGTETEKIDSVFADFKSHYADHCAEKTAPYDGICDLISALKKNGVKTAVVSNKADFAVQSLCKTYFDGVFDYAVGEKEGVRTKPCPDSVLETVRALDSDMGATVYVGDSEVDIQTAKNACIPCVSVDWGFKDKSFLTEHGAAVIAEDTDELLCILSKMLAF